MLERMKDLILPEKGEDAGMGGLLLEDYSRVARGLRSMGLIDSVPSFTSFYKVIRDDSLIKSRHSGENRSPDDLQLFEKTGFRLSPE